MVWNYRCGYDDAISSIVTSAHVAVRASCRDPDVMARTFAFARALRSRVGAHPGFPDLFGLSAAAGVRL